MEAVNKLQQINGNKWHVCARVSVCVCLDVYRLSSSKLHQDSTCPAASASHAWKAVVMTSVSFHQIVITFCCWPVQFLLRDAMLASLVLAIVLCLSVSTTSQSSINAVECIELLFYHGSFLASILYCVIRKFRYSQKYRLGPSCSNSIISITLDLLYNFIPILVQQLTKFQLI